MLLGSHAINERLSLLKHCFLGMILELRCTSRFVLNLEICFCCGELHAVFQL